VSNAALRNSGVTNGRAVAVEMSYVTGVVVPGICTCLSWSKRSTLAQHPELLVLFLRGGKGLVIN
jgi:hypothetical protein